MKKKAANYEARVNRIIRLSKSYNNNTAAQEDEKLLNYFIRFSPSIYQIAIQLLQKKSSIDQQLCLEKLEKFYEQKNFQEALRNTEQFENSIQAWESSINTPLWIKGIAFSILFFVMLSLLCATIILSGLLAPLGIGLIITGVAALTCAVFLTICALPSLIGLFSAAPKLRALYKLSTEQDHFLQEELGYPYATLVSERSRVQSVCFDGYRGDAAKTKILLDVKNSLEQNSFNKEDFESSDKYRLLSQRQTFWFNKKTDSVAAYEQIYSDYSL